MQHPMAGALMQHMQKQRCMHHMMHNMVVYRQNISLKSTKIHMTGAVFWRQSAQVVPHTLITPSSSGVLLSTGGKGCGELGRGVYP